jgi:hypothetical protein
MKLPLYRYKKQAIVGAVVIAAIATLGVQFATTGSVPAAVPSPAASRLISTGIGIQYITRAKASGPASSAKASASPSSKNAKNKAKVKVSLAPSAAVGSGVGSGVTSRSPYSWPFSWDSIWNVPIASTAEYEPVNIQSDGIFEDGASADYDSVKTSFPVVTLENARLASGSTGAVSVYGDPSMTADGNWNTCSAFLGTDGQSVYQGQTTELTAGGNPSFGGVADATWSPVNIKGTGTAGCHGGSGLSGLGGTLTQSDLTQSGPIAHVLKIALDGYLNYSSANGGFRWPASNADTGFNQAGSAAFYGGSNGEIQEGSLLALPPSINVSSFSNPTVRKIAAALQDYGAYIVDDAGGGNTPWSTFITNYNSSSTLLADASSSGLNALIQDLQVVANNTASTPGGGEIGVSRCASYAPVFDDGSDAPPAVKVASC